MRILALTVVAGCAYHPPLDPPRDDAGGLAPDVNVIAGTVVADIETPGTVILFATAADNPMPPFGTGQPITFSTVPASRFSDDGTGLKSADFAIGGVPDGDYTITALMDLDDSFHPLYSSRAGASCGDVVGAYIDGLATQQLAVVHVEGNEKVDGLSILLGSQIPVERPAFVFNGFGTTDQGSNDNVVDRTADPTVHPEEFRLLSTGVHSQLLETPDPGEPCGPVFVVYAPDADGDGVYDPSPTYGSLGLYDLWPRIYLQYMGDVAEGERWAAEAVPDPAFALLGRVPPGGTLVTTDLSVAWLPAAQHFLADGTVEVIQDPSRIPTGAWSVTVVSHTGQTWTLPNELAAYPADEGAFSPGSQAEYLVVQ
jgi:hypothetical protein